MPSLARFAAAFLAVAMLSSTSSRPASAEDDDQPRAVTVEPGGPISSDPLDIPEPKPEVITPEPSQEHVWVPGYWERDTGQWVWVEGRWVKPPLLRSRWVPGYWKHEPPKYRWHPGHWAVGETGVIVEKPIAVPAVLKEAEPGPPPSPDAVWVPGGWEWNGTWVWTPGRYSVRPLPGTVWVPGRWKEGLLGRWRWIPAHWGLG